MTEFKFKNITYYHVKDGWCVRNLDEDPTDGRWRVYHGTLVEGEPRPAIVSLFENDMYERMEDAVDSILIRSRAAQAGRGISTKRAELSDKQQEIYEAILRCVMENGYQPTHEELAEQFGLNLRAATDRMLQLEVNGFVRRSPNKQFRTLELPHVKFRPVREKRYEDMGLSPKETQLYVFMMAHVMEHGSQPTKEQAGAALGGDYYLVERLLDRLVEAGLLEFTQVASRASRSLRFVGVWFEPYFVER